ncbi:TadE/TadG family type IV pilus assembly protein [Luteococcus sp. Sow4_B9]|uniref:TadE/TadG family type IV pilus assembly protein n=1 Tax=Luteococcus sp. Sow4_B9 TaxID=3438792 RepID=UPI003F963A27
MSESVQWAVLLPVLMLGILGAIQTGIVLYGRSVAAHAALAGAEAQALAGASGGSGERVARELAEQGGLRDVKIVVARPGGEVRVQVRGRVDTFFAVGPTTVEGDAVMPMELP